MENIQETNTLNAQKKRQDDEYYTLYETIEEELCHYKNQLTNKKIYCNCDNACVSQFWNYFYNNFKELGIKSIDATCYNKNSRGEHWHFDDNSFDIEYEMLDGDGSFNSDECKNILNDIDVVITNPPFSLFREFVNVLINANKNYLIIGSMNATMTNNVFECIKNKIMWFGYTRPNKFRRADNTFKSVQCWWFTNLIVDNYNKDIQYTKKYNEDEFPKYQNYNAIDCKNGANIPFDYKEAIGIPSAYLINIDFEKFDILEHHEPAIELELFCKRGYKPHKSRQIKVNDTLCNKTFHRVFIKWKNNSGSI